MTWKIRNSGPFSIRGLGICGILFLGFFLRVYDLDQENLWLDELYSVQTVADSAVQIVHDKIHKKLQKEFRCVDRFEFGDYMIFINLIEYPTHKSYVLIKYFYDV